MVKLKYKNKNYEIVKSFYLNNEELYIGMVDRNGDIYSDITINLCGGYTLDNNEGFLSGDITNELENCLIENGIIKEYITTIPYNFGTYKMVEFGRVEEMREME